MLMLMLMFVIDKRFVLHCRAVLTWKSQHENLTNNSQWKFSKIAEGRLSE